jgi:hypothetical protein
VVSDTHFRFGPAGNEPFEDMVLMDVAAGMDEVRKRKAARLN